MLAVCAYFRCTYTSNVKDANYHNGKELMKDYVSSHVNEQILI